MYAYKEIITLDDLQHISLKKPLALKKGQRIELLILADNDDKELESIRDHIAEQNINEIDIANAIQWSREK